jgi:hypothetical protein
VAQKLANRLGRTNGKGINIPVKVVTNQIAEKVNGNGTKPVRDMSTSGNTGGYIHNIKTLIVRSRRPAMKKRLC